MWLAVLIFSLPDFAALNTQALQAYNAHDFKTFSARMHVLLDAAPRHTRRAAKAPAPMSCPRRTIF